MENNTNAANCLLLLYAFNTAKNVKDTICRRCCPTILYILGVCIVNIATNNNFNIYFKIVLLDLEKENG